MNYLNLYNRIIDKASNDLRTKDSNLYYEAHHIKPKSLFPEFANDPSNIVLLTAREHYIAHWLLTKIYPSKSMNYAFLIMCNKATKKGTERTYKVNSKVYEKLKQYYRNNSPSSTSEAKEKISKAKSGENHHFFGIPSEESPTYKAEVFHLIHVSGAKFSGTRTDIRNKLHIAPSLVSALVTGRQYTAKGWSIIGIPKPIKKGADVNNADLSLRIWYNTVTGVGYFCHKHDFIKLTKLKLKSVNTLINKTRNSVFNWVLLTPNQ